MFHHRVDEYQFVAFRVEGYIFVFQPAAVEAYQVAGLTEDGGKLVHDAALHAAVVVFGSLSYLGQLKLVYAQTVEVVQGEGKVLSRAADEERPAPRGTSPEKAVSKPPTFPPRLMISRTTPKM